MKTITHDMNTMVKSRKLILALALLTALLLPAAAWATDITSLSSIGSSGDYVITQDIDATGFTTIASFSGTLEAAINPATHMPYRIKNLTAPLFTTLTGTVKNLVIESVTISGHTGNTGAIACTANGAARIYNVGILSGSVGGTAYTGGLVGLLDGTARVVNSYSYAEITGGSNVGGIVGYNNVSTTSGNLKTMVFGCMFYGNISGGNNKAPIYNGTNITNVSNSGVSNYNYFWSGAAYVKSINTYNCALMAETRFLNRFEFFRHLLNGHRELAGWWATGSYDKTPMLKWVMRPDSIGSNHPFPILMEFGKYPSVVNIDAANAQENQPRNQGGKLGTLAVTIQMGSGGAVYGPPTGAQITTSQLTLNITDKDTAHFNFNYYKVQLPYYNDVGSMNYTGYRVVTGWKIVSITGGTKGNFYKDADVTYTNGELTKTPYNFADRTTWAKDFYGTGGSNRVFNQGAYWDVPEGVTAITIEPYWGKAAYLADANADVVYDKDMSTAKSVPNVGGLTGTGNLYTNGNGYNINGDNQVVFTDRGNAISSSGTGNALFQGVTGTPGSQTVYDYAVVLVGNYHHVGNMESTNDKPYTFTSVDLDGDNEPDYSYILRFNSRNKLHPVRVDFVNIPGLGMAQKSHGGKGTYNFGIMQPKGWFETTNTSLFRETQFEYDNTDRVAAPYILQGGVMEQWVSGQSAGAANKTIYYLVGGNVWFKEFHRGTHQDKVLQSKHPPVSVTGGDFDQFYLTGLYTSNVVSYNDNAECYINGGRFDTIAGAGMEGIGHPTNHTNGNITWIIDNADIKEFYAGGINAANPVEGNLHTIIKNSRVWRFVGGPKFGDLNSGRTVTNTATNCDFVLFFGAGYGGNSYSRYPPYNYNNVKYNIDWNKWVNGGMHVAGYDAGYVGFQHEYNSTYKGVSAQIDYQFIPMSGNLDNCCRLWIEYVKFSLAKTRNVTSTLTNCTIDSNFYGGGSLGKVEGNVTSVLDGCIVKGNVFGAGYSATVPKVAVMELGGFIEPPGYDENTGSYLPATFPDTVHYTWAPATVNVINSTENAVDNDAHILYTTEALDSLGIVSGTVSLTIKGNSFIGTKLQDGTLKPKTGNVYGGGDQSAVYKKNDEANAKTEVILEGDTHVYGHVFAGGNEGVVSGSTTVTVKDTPPSP